MIIVRLESGLGNQLFQYAVGRRLAHKWNTELKLDLSILGQTNFPYIHGRYGLGEFNIQENIATPGEIQLLKQISTKKIWVLKEIPINLYRKF